MATAQRRKPPKKTSPADEGPPTPLAEGRPFLRFYHSESLRRKTLSVLGRLEQADDPTEHAEALGDLVVELMQSGMDYYLMQPLKQAKVGFVVEQSANISLACALKVVNPVLRGIIGRMGAAQLISICGSIRQLMV